MGQRLSTRWWPDFAIYIDLICPYNGRDFSYPQDALLGIGGVLNALGNSFPGGFVCGLPRLFFDHALLWQPFGTAERRMDRVEDGSSRSSLPSWSWCGWRGFVDPWSLRSGLSYIHDEVAQDRARSWSTRNLVQWSLSVGDQRSEPLLEPCILDQYEDANLTTARKQFELPDGWKGTRIMIPGNYKEEFDTELSVFFHERDETTIFKHPVPLKALREGSSAQSLGKIPACLTCSTNTASLSPAAVLKRETTSYQYWHAISKISAFEDRIFKRGPPDEKASPVLVLQQENGTFGGLIRLMTDSHVDQDSSLQLVAISTGSANAHDLCRSFEWTIFEEGMAYYSYDSTDRKIHYAPEWISEKGKNALLFDFAMVFDQTAAGNETPEWDLDAALTNIDRQTEEKIMKALPKVSREDRTGDKFAQSDLLTEKLARDPTLADNKSFRDKQWFKVLTKSHWENHSTDPRYFNVSWNPLNRVARGVPFSDSLAYQQFFDQKEMICEFYNVLWVENRDGILYRRGCGWVPKLIWESIATGPVEIKLG